jgi:hypothetical protein
VRSNVARNGEERRDGYALSRSLMCSRIARRWPLRRRERGCTAAEHRKAVREMHALQRLSALEFVRLGALDVEICEATKITQARLDAWFVADAAFWNERFAFRDECLTTIREAASQGDFEALRWLQERGVPLK